MVKQILRSLEGVRTGVTLESFEPRIVRQGPVSFILMHDFHMMIKSFKRAMVDPIQTIATRKHGYYLIVNRFHVFLNRLAEKNEAANATRLIKSKCRFESDAIHFSLGEEVLRLWRGRIQRRCQPMFELSFDSVCVHITVVIVFKAYVATVGKIRDDGELDALFGHSSSTTNFPIDASLLHRKFVF